MATPDLVPSVTSRLVTIDVVTMTEDAPADGWVDFTLPCDLHVPADDKIIQAGTVRVDLERGQGQVRLPTFDPDAKPDDWAILVQKSWAPHAYAIRVPSGTAAASLADLGPVEVTTSMARVWSLSGAGVVVEAVGSNDGASGEVSVSGGIANFVLRVPRGAPGLGGALEQLGNGNYRVVSAGSGATIDTVAAAMGFYLLQGPATSETVRNGLPVYWIEKA